jgi:hypothetical protein
LPCPNSCTFLLFLQVFCFFCFWACRAYSAAAILGPRLHAWLSHSGLTSYLCAASVGPCRVAWQSSAASVWQCLQDQGAALVALQLPPPVSQLQALPRSSWQCRAVPVSGRGSVGRSVIRTNVRLGPFEQIFETLVRVAFWPCLSEFPTESDRILTESRTKSQPNLDRISESLSLTVQPNPNRIWKSVKDFILLAACSLGVRCKIYVLALVGCWGLLVSNGRPGMGHLFSCPRCIGDSKGLSLGPAWHAFCSLLRTGLFLFFFRHAWLLAFAQSLSDESHSVIHLWSAFHNLGKVLHT